MKIVFVLFPGVHLLDVSGPAQVFSTATTLGKPYDLHYVGATDQVTSAQGLVVQTGTQWPELTKDDVLAVVGYRTPAGQEPPPLTAATEALRQHHDRGGTVASICVGAGVLAEAGLLDGRECTTHHKSQEALARKFPAATVKRDVLFVDDDRVMTSAGIASGIDLALHMVAKQHGPGFAARVARDMVVFARRNGDSAQSSAYVRHRTHIDDLVHEAQDVIDARYSERLPLEDLAEALGVSTRTLTRAFSAATGITPLQYQQEIRLENAELLLAAGATSEEAARTIGFSDARMLRRLRAAAARQR